MSGIHRLTQKARNNSSGKYTTHIHNTIGSCPVTCRHKLTENRHIICVKHTKTYPKQHSPHHQCENRMTISIYIENPSPNCDITITITSSTGEEVYRQTFSESQTAYMVIRIGNLTSGQYTLQMANNQGNYLTGVFGI